MKNLTPCLQRERVLRLRRGLRKLEMEELRTKTLGFKEKPGHEWKIIYRGHSSGRELQFRPIKRFRPPPMTFCLIAQNLASLNWHFTSLPFMWFYLYEVAPWLLKIAWLPFTVFFFFFYWHMRWGIWTTYLVIISTNYMLVECSYWHLWSSKVTKNSNP